jgi:hypothetical protein
MAAHGSRPAIGNARDRLSDRGAKCRASAFSRDFQRGMAESGYVEGKNFAIEYRLNPESLPEAATELVRRNHAMRIPELLALPDYVFLLARLCFGWPSQEGFVSLRLHMALTVHVDRYDDTNLAAEIDGYDRRRDARHSIPENDWRQVGRFGKHRSMADRRTRLVRSRCLKGSISEHSFAVSVSNWTTDRYLNPDQRIASR